jgi:hypothetical protein
MNGVKKHITTPRFTWRGPKDGMTRASRKKSFPQEIRYYFLILGKIIWARKTSEQIGRTIQGDKHFVAWSGNTSK